MRLLEILEAPFDKVDCFPVRLMGQERVSDLHHFSIEVLLPRVISNVPGLLGRVLALRVAEQGDVKPRIINGLLTEIQFEGEQQTGQFRYRFCVASSLYLTTLRQANRVFQNKSVQDILAEILGDYGADILSTYKLSVVTEPQEYIVQYNENDFDFICRLCSKYGVYFVVQYPNGSGSMRDQTVVFSDTVEGYFVGPNNEFQIGAADQTESERQWALREKAHAASWKLDDYTELTPSQNLTVTAPSRQTKHSALGGERAQYAVGYLRPPIGTNLANFAMDAEEAEATVLSGTSLTPTVSCGGIVSLVGAPNGLSEKRWVFVSVEHDATDYAGVPGYIPKADDEGLSRYTNRYESVPANKVVRAAYVPQIRRMPGLQTGIVVGPDGEITHTDEMGRIKVQLHWNREASGRPDPTCWIRVAHAFAGKGFGTQFIPRIGMEVLVDFIEGDPDRPVIVGAVYNKENGIPYKPPAANTQTGVKTTLKAPIQDNKFNELRFDDKDGSEEVFFHAGKDFIRHVRNNDTLKVDNKQSINIKTSRTTKIEESDDSLTLVKGSRDVTLNKGDLVTKLDAGSYDLEVFKDYGVKVATGDHKTKVSAGASSLQAMTKIEFKVGASAITIDNSGITIKAPMVKVEGSASVDVKAAMVKVKGNAMASIEAPITKASGSGLLMLKGGVVMIN